MCSRPNKNSTGNDQMPYTVINKFSPAILMFIKIFLNQLISCGYFPQIWKCAKIIPIPKPQKDDSLIKNWRPISQLNCLAKIYEKIVHGRLNKIIHDNVELFQNQFGFRSGLSTTHALSGFQRDVNAGLNRRMATTIINLD